MDKRQKLSRTPACTLLCYFTADILHEARKVALFSNVTWPQILNYLSRAMKGTASMWRPGNGTLLSENFTIRWPLRVQYRAADLVRFAASQFLTSSVLFCVAWGFFSLLSCLKRNLSSSTLLNKVIHSWGEKVIFEYGLDVCRKYLHWDFLFFFFLIWS